MPPTDRVVNELRIDLAVYLGSAQKTEKIVRQAELFSNWSSSDSR